jgi:hypothetical protein
MAQTTRNIDWPTYPLKPHQVAASAPTPDRSTTPAERMTREWRDDLTNPGPLQKPFLTRTVHDASMFDYRMLRNYTRSSFRLDVCRPDHLARPARAMLLQPFSMTFGRRVDRDRWGLPRPAWVFLNIFYLRSTESLWMPLESPAACAYRIAACGPGDVLPTVGAVAGSCPTK